MRSLICATKLGTVQEWAASALQQRTVAKALTIIVATMMIIGSGQSGTGQILLKNVVKLKPYIPPVNNNPGGPPACPPGSNQGLAQGPGGVCVAVPYICSPGTTPVDPFDAVDSGALQFGCCPAGTVTNFKNSQGESFVVPIPSSNSFNCVRLKNGAPDISAPTVSPVVPMCQSGMTIDTIPAGLLNPTNYICTSKPKCPGAYRFDINGGNCVLATKLNVPNLPQSSPQQPPSVNKRPAEVKKP